MHRLPSFSAKCIALFRRGLLTQAEPANNAAEDKVTLLEVLDRAAEKVESRFADQPELEQALRVTIMHTYHGLASWKKAESQARALLELLQSRKPRSSEAYQIQAELAHMLWHVGRRDAEVLELAETAVRSLERISPDRISTLTASNHLATIYSDTGRLPEAIALLERNRDISITKPTLRVFVGALVDAYALAGENAKLVKLLQEQLAEARETLPKDSPQLARIGP